MYAGCDLHAMTSRTVEKHSALDHAPSCSLTTTPTAYLTPPHHSHFTTNHVHHRTVSRTRACPVAPAKAQPFPDFVLEPRRTLGTETSTRTLSPTRSDSRRARSTRTTCSTSRTSDRSPTRSVAPPGIAHPYRQGSLLFFPTTARGGQEG